MKKIVALLLAMLMVISLVGCSKDKETNDNKDDGKNNEVVSDDKGGEDDKPAEKTEITMWTIATESDSNHEPYMKAIEEVQKNNPNITLKMETFENESYKTKIKASVSADELPDIFFTWGAAFIGDFISADKVYCVDDVYAKYKSQLPEGMMVNAKFDGHYYAAPTNFNIAALFANMDILKTVGYDKVPATYDELIDCCDKLVAAGIYPFGCAGKETWCVSEYVESMIEKSAGAEALANIFDGKASWDNADLIKAVSMFQEMISKGYFDPDGVALSNDEVKQKFMDGKIAFYLNGTWNCGDFIAKMTSKVEVSEFPVINPAKSQLGELIGGPNDSLAVAKSSKNAALAADIAFQVAKVVCKEAYLRGNGLYTWTPDYDTSSVNELTNAVAAICANSKYMVLFGDNKQEANRANIYLDYLGKIYASEISAEEFAKQLAQELPVK